MSRGRFFALMRDRQRHGQKQGRPSRRRPRRRSSYLLEPFENRVLLSATPVATLGLDPSPDPLLAPLSDGPDTSLEAAAVESLKTEAIRRLSLLGAPEASLSGLHAVEIQIADLPGWTLATTTPTGIALDRDAAGHGWFIDPTPTDDAEFAGIDLLTVLAHELGHELGLGHAPVNGSETPSAFDELMQAGLRPGVRRIEATPDLSDATAVVLSAPVIGEALEITATIRWNTDANGFWDVAANWIDTQTLQARTPTASDDILIDRGAANPIVTVRTSTSGHHVLSTESVVIGGGGTLDLSGTLSSSVQAQLTGGTLTHATIEAGTTVAASSGGLDAITLGGTIVANTSSLTVTGGMTLQTGSLFQMQGIVRFNGDQTVSGPGEIRFVSPGVNMIVAGNLTLGPGTTIDGTSGTININSGSFTNRGTIGPNPGGSITIGTGATQVWSNAVGGVLRADGGTLSLGGTWSNAGEIVVGSTAGSMLSLGGSFTKAGLGTLTRNGTANNTIRLSGVLDNTGATLALDATTGSWDIVAFGRLKGGTLSTSGGAQLNALRSGFDWGTLDGITLSGTVIVNAVSIAGGLTMAPGSLIQITTGTFGGALVFDGNQTIGGTGDIRFVGSSNEINIRNAVTFGSGITVSGGQLANIQITGVGFFTNQGTINGASPGGQFTIGFTGQNWTNAGTLRTDGARLILGGNWSNTGTILVGNTAGSILDLGGNFTTAGIGTITRNGTANNSINIIGVLTNTGAALALNAATGSWNLKDGTIRGGTVTTADGVRLFETGFSSTIDGLTLGGTFFANRVRVTGGLTLQPGALFEIGGTNADGVVTTGTVTFSGTQTIGGTGVIRFGPTGTNSLTVSGGQLTIGSGITIDGLRGSLNMAISGGASSLVNQGTIAPSAGGNFDVGNETKSFTNAAGGILKADGATLRLLGDWTNTGEIVVGAATGSILNLDGTFTTARLGTYTRNGGTINLLGTLDNTGATLALNAATGSWNLVSNGKIKGGTLSTADGTALTTVNLGNNLDSELEGLTLSGRIITAGSQLTVKGGLTLTAGSLFQIGQITGGNTTYGEVTFEGSQTIGGTGEIRFVGARPGVNFASRLRVVHTGSATQTALTIDPGITLDGDAVDLILGNGITITNRGTITTGNSTGGSFIGDNGLGSFVNEGSMLYTNAGVTLNAVITFAEGSTFRNPGGVTSLKGRLENAGKTLTLDDDLGIFTLIDNGTIKGGTVETVGANELEFFHLTGILDGVVLRGTANLALPRTNFIELRVLNGLTLDNGLIRLGVSAPVTFVGTQTLGGTGTILFADNSTFNATVNAVLVPTAGTTLTIGPDITVRGKTGKVEAAVGAAVDVQGTVAADDGGTITVTRASNIAPTALTGGHWQAVGNSTLRLVGTRIATNTADILLDGAGARILDDNSTTTTLSALTANAAAGTLTVRNGSRYGPALNFDNAGNVTIGGGSVFSQLVTSQFANSVIAFSSQFSTTTFSAAQALGAPNVPAYANDSRAWSASAQNGGAQFITVGFATPVFAEGATIRESFGNGFVTQIDVLDTSDVLHTVFTGIDPSLPGSLVDFRVSWDRTPYLVKGLKVYTNTDHDLAAREEIDAIQLHGVTTPGTYRQTAGATVLNGGTIVFGTVDLQGGSLAGTGKVDANLIDAALVAPGAPTGTLTVTRNYTQTAAGHLGVDIGGTAAGQFDKIAIQGSATLAGTLDVALANGFGPAPGQIFDVATYASATGTFDTINGAAPLFVVDQGPTVLSLNAVASTSDLAFDGVTIPVSGVAGQSFGVSYTVDNLAGAPATGDWFDSIYLSSAPVLDERAVLLGREHHVGDVAGGGSYTGGLNAPMPNLTAGNYHVLVLVDSRGDVPDPDRTNNLGVSTGKVAVTVPLLTVGTPVTGQIANGQDVYFRLVVPPGQDFNVEASFVASNEAEFYLRFGALPDRSEFDLAADPSESQPKLSVTNAQGGDYYILLHGREGAGTGVAFTVRAEVAGLAIKKFTPDRMSNEGDATVTLTGTGFTEGTSVTLINVLGDVYATADVTFIDSQHLHATFHLERDDVPTGFFNLRATDDGQSVTAGDVLEIGGIGGLVSMTLIAPGAVRVGMPIPVTINIENAGGSNAVAPIIEVRASNVAENQKHQQFFADGGDDTLPGIIPPHTKSEVGIIYNPVPQAAGIESGFDLIVANPSTTLIDWDSQKESYRPSHVSLAAWDAVWANFRPRMGSTLADLYAVLMGDRRALAQFGVPTSDIHDLLQFELEKAANEIPASSVLAATDLMMPGQGMVLMYQRTHSMALADRFREGRLGIGWTDNFDAKLTTDSNGLVTIRQTNTVRFFGRLANGTYLGFPGETATLTAAAGGALQLHDNDGVTYGFRSDGLLDFIRDPNGNQLTAHYVGSTLSSVEHSDGGTLAFTYNADGRVSRVTDSTGRTANYTYDAAGHLASVVTAAGETSYTYTSETTGPHAHGVESVTNPDGTHRFFTYDSHGRLSRQEADGGAEAVTYIYNVNGYSATDALGRTSSMFFDVAGRPAVAFDPGGHAIQTVFDEANNLTKISVPGGGSNTLTYDAKGNPTSSVSPSGDRQAFQFEPGSTLLSGLVDGAGNAIAYTNDAAGNIQAITYADGSSEHHSYDADGNLTRSVTRSGQEITYTYDSRGLLLQKTLPGNQHVDYAYDARGNLTSTVDASGTTTLVHDEADRLIKITYPSGLFLSYTYDAGGRRTEVVDQSGFTQRYAYDAVGRLARVTDTGGNLVVQYTYDAAGQLVREDKGNGTHTTYEYNLTGQVLHLVHFASDGTERSRFDYSYDALGHRTGVTTLDGSTGYTYDGAGRLVGVSLPGGRTIAYQYDAAGNRIAVVDTGATTSYVTNTLNQYTAIGGASYGYDANGNLISGSGRSYTYDVEGRLIGAIGPDGTWSYEYDALGNRVATTHDGVATQYLIDPTGLGHVFGEFEADGDVIAHYTQGTGLESRVGANGQAAYYDFDALGSTQQLTGADGSILNSYSYLPFGELLSSQESVENPFSYVGEYGVAEEGGGLYFMRARSYDAAAGRFVQPDPIGTKGGINLYAYTGNAPTEVVDPSGWMPDYIHAATSFGKVQAKGPAQSYSVNYQQHFNQPGGNPGPGTQLSPRAALQQAQNNGLNAYRAARDAQQAASRLSRFGNAAAEAVGIAVWAAAFWYGNSAIQAEFWKFSHMGQLPLCPSDGSNVFGKALNAITVCRELPRFPGESIWTDSTRQVGSADPNELFGPDGFGPDHSIQPEGLFPYVIYFENKSSATAPAQIVSVTEQLDADLDWSTFEFGDLGWGDFVLDVPDGRQFFSTRVDRSGEQGLLVDVTAEFNAATGLATWTFVSLDPITFDAPADPFAGFLPPNNDEHDGEGFTTYFIEPKDDLATGTVVTALATIVFDSNASLDTPLWSNTIDSGGPSSSVAALPAVTTTADFTVNWSGTDDAGGSGIAYYDVFVSDDGGAYTALLTGTTLTSTTFAGQVGHTYAFFSVASDNVGHRETDPASPDATTQVVELQTNEAPVLAPIGDRSVAEGALLTFVIAATDADVPAQTLTFSGSALPAGASFDPATRTFAWTPTEAQGPGVYVDILFSVSDGVESDSETITITVGEINQSPVLAPIGDRSVAEGALLTFTIDATDADLPSNPLTFSATGLPAGASFDPGTRTFSWMPTEAQGPGVYGDITFVVSDGVESDTETIAITVGEVNQPPVLGAIGDRTVAEGVLLTFVIGATDPDLPANVLAFSATGLPTGAAFDASTRTFSWMPTEAQGPGAFTGITFSVSDGSTSDSETITITVGEANQPPVLARIGDRSVDEGTLLTFVVGATDADLPANALTYNAVGLPEGASFDPDTQTFTWMPTEAQGPSVFSGITFTVGDGAEIDSETIAITVAEVNQAPVLEPIGNQTIAEGALLTFVVSATDADLPANTLTFDATGLPGGASFDPATRTFSWMPSEAQGPAVFSGMTFTVSDGVDSDSETIDITVTEGNRPPVLAPIGNRTVAEGSSLIFTVSATDVDTPEQPLTFSASGLPVGASFDPATRTFSWTPSEAQGPAVFSGITFTVSDGVDSDSETIDIPVTEVNQAPVLAPIGNQTIAEGALLTFVVEATDDDVPANPLIFSATGMPEGATFNPATRTFSWTPSEAQGPGVFSGITFTGSDGAESDSEAIAITVTEVNQAPVLAPIGDQTIEEGALLTFVVNATDFDLPANALTFGATGLPDGASFDPTTRTLSWTPSEAQGPGVFTGITFTISDGVDSDSETMAITVTEVNQAPVLAPIGNQTIAEGALLTFVVNATDADLPANTLTFGATGLPVGASFDPATRTFSWTPGEAQGPVVFTGITFTAGDGVDSDSETIVITVTEVIQAPVARDDAATTDEDTSAVIAVLANDSDADGTLDPATVVITTPTSHGTTHVDSVTGAVTYAPAPNFFGIDTFEYTVTDNEGFTSNEAVVTITVLPVNDAPTANGDSYATDEDTLLVVGAGPGVLGNDTDVEGTSLTALLVTGPAHGTLALDANGAFTYQSAADFFGSDSFTYVARDGAANSTPATVAITVRPVNDAPVARDDAATTTADTPVAITPLANDTDVDGALNVATLAIVGPASHGTTQVDPLTGAVTYTPAVGFTGTDTFRYTVQDAQGLGSNEAVVTITVNPVASAPTARLVPDPVDPQKTALLVIGTDAEDVIRFVPAGKKGDDVKVLVNGETLGTFRPTGHILAYGRGGNDDIEVAGAITLPAQLYGEDGDDRLKAGAGPTVLVGGQGDDHLGGGHGRDLLIGGAGADRVVGGPDEDILIGGLTSYDADPNALGRIAIDWNRTDLSHTERVHRLGIGPFPLGVASITDDGSKDTLTGASGRNDFFAGVGDHVTDAHALSGQVGKIWKLVKSVVIPLFIAR